MIAYQALYNPMVEESGYTTLSTHLSREGAEKAIANHKAEQLKEFITTQEIEKQSPYYDPNNPYWTDDKFGQWEDWGVAKIEILP